MQDCNQKTHANNAKLTKKNGQFARSCTEYLTLTHLSIDPVMSKEPVCPASGNGDRAV